jgi:hypothetical protein
LPDHIEVTISITDWLSNYISAVLGCSWLPRSVQASGSLFTASEFIPSLEWKTSSADAIVQVFCSFLRTHLNTINQRLINVGEVRVHQTAEYMELDCNIRTWSLIARRALFSLWDSVPNSSFEIGAVVRAVWLRMAAVYHFEIHQFRTSRFAAVSANVKAV